MAGRGVGLLGQIHRLWDLGTFAGLTHANIESLACVAPMTVYDTFGIPTERRSDRNSARSSWVKSREGGRDGPPGRPVISRAALTGGDSPLVRAAIFPRKASQT